MNSPFHIYQLSIHFLPFCSYTNTETLYIITKTPGGFPWLYGQFPCLYKGFACGYRAALCTHLFHLPKRAGHSPDKAPLALHIGFQIFRALPVCLPDCFRVIQMFHNCTGGTVSALHPGRYTLSHRVQEPLSYPFLPFRFILSRKPPDFCVKVYFCLIVRFFPQSPSYQRHLKTKKLFCYLFLGYPLEYRFHFFSAYIVPFHDYFCGWVLSGGSLPCVAVFAHKSAPLQ